MFLCEKCGRGYLAMPTGQKCFSRLGSNKQYPCTGKVICKNAVHTYADGKLPHQAGTSKIAAEAELFKQESFAERVFNLFVSTGGVGLTDDELIEITGNISARPRRIGLMHKGVVKDTGRRRPTIANRPAVVWALRAYCKEDEQNDREQQA